MRLPWQHSLWQQLTRYRSQQRLPAALLLSAPLGMGIARLGQDWLASLCCLEASVEPCGICSGCVLFAAGNHPDVQTISPEAPGKSLSVEAVRTALAELQQTPQVAAFRIAYIESAEALTVSAANALLKTLEEPYGQGLWILVTEQSWRLPATVRSRCQILKQPPITEEEATQWLLSEGVPAAEAEHLLQLAEGRPLVAQHWHQQGLEATITDLFAQCSALAAKQAEPLAVAKAYLDYPLLEVLGWVRLWLKQRMRALRDLDGAALWQCLQNERYLTTLEHTVVKQPSVNKQLVMESLMIALSQRQGANYVHPL